MKFSIKDYFSKCDQILRKLRIWLHLLEEYLMENFIFLCIYSFCKTLHLKFIVNLCYLIHQNTFRTLAYLELCLFRYTEAFSIIFSTIKACSVLIRYIQNPVKVSCSQPCLMPSPARCKIGGILKPYETSPRHIQNSTIVRIVFQALLNHIQAS